jgi:hypothetical protein
MNRSALCSSFLSAIVAMSGCAQAEQPVFLDDDGTQQQELNASGFAFCSAQCGRFFVGYGRTNTATLDAAQDTTGALPAIVLKNVADAGPALSLQAYRLDERRIDLENGTRASSVHRIESAKIGNLRKSETMLVEGAFANGRVASDVRLVFGDTFTVRSRTLANGSTVRVRVTRTIGGFGNPFTPDAFYDVRSSTAVSGQVLPALAFSFAKAPGVGEVDVQVGNFVESAEIDVRVGVPFTLEGELRVVDGVRGVSGSNQGLNGADAATYDVALVSPAVDACVKSSSGTYALGNCNSL